MQTINKKTVKKKIRRLIAKTERKAFKSGLDARSVKIAGRNKSGGYIYKKSKSVIYD